MREEPHRLVFVDETGTTTKMTRLRGRARRGERLRASAPFGHWGTQTFIAALRCDGLTAPWVIDQPINRLIFETWVETQLAPTLQLGDVVILDNLSSHKSEKAKAIVKERGAWFLFLPPYSPASIDRRTFAKFKASQASRRTIEPVTASATLRAILTEDSGTTSKPQIRVGLNARCSRARGVIPDRMPADAMTMPSCRRS